MNNKLGSSNKRTHEKLWARQLLTKSKAFNINASITLIR